MAKKKKKKIFKCKVEISEKTVVLLLISIIVLIGALILLALV
ncbi:MAG TPA: hypothetical protein PLT65_02895 [Bacilli bacterium]|nr:hypothetical protein [Bacilli bacterium]